MDRTQRENGLQTLQVGGGGTGGRETGEKVAGGVREAGEEGAGSGIPKVAGSRSKREKLCNIAQYFAIEKMQRTGAKKYRAGTGIKGYGKREVQTPLSPPPPPHLQITLFSVRAAVYVKLCKNLVCVQCCKVQKSLAPFLTTYVTDLSLITWNVWGLQLKVIIERCAL